MTRPDSHVQHSTRSLLLRLASDMTELVGNELALARAELSDAAHAARAGLPWAIIAASLMLTALLSSPSLPP